MSLLQWDDGFETGIPAADHEHGKMIDLINSIHRRWEGKSGSDPSKLRDALLEVLQAHFAFEDRLMAAIEYADHDVHTSDHIRAVDEIERIFARGALFDADMRNALAAYLQQWLPSHIAGHDAPFYKQLASDKGTSVAVPRAENHAGARRPI